MYPYLVDENALLSDEKFLCVLNFAMLLPGPKAQQLAPLSDAQCMGCAAGLAAGGMIISRVKVVYYKGYGYD